MSARAGCAVDAWASPNGVQDVGGQPEVQHFLDEDTADQRVCVRVALRVQSIERAEIGRQHRVFQLYRPLQVFPKVVKCVDRRLRPGRLNHVDLQHEVGLERPAALVAHTAKTWRRSCL